ncbi:MAG: hypothetical protein ACU83V_02820 [Gammaproteobacteria bacterium]
MTFNAPSVLHLIKAGDWDAAHHVVQQCADPLACRIHAYLHRLEGDLDNAQYWYDRANVPVPTDTLDEEFDCLCELAQNDS